MVKGFLAAAVLATFAGAAQAGTLQNGTYTPTCTDPGAPPAVSDKSPTAFNASQKAIQAWAETLHTYVTCIQADGKADVEIISKSLNDKVTVLNQEQSQLNDAMKAAVDKLKAKNK